MPVSTIVLHVAAGLGLSIGGIQTGDTWAELGGLHLAGHVGVTPRLAGFVEYDFLRASEDGGDGNVHRLVGGLRVTVVRLDEPTQIDCFVDAGIGQQWLDLAAHDESRREYSLGVGMMVPFPGDDQPRTAMVMSLRSIVDRELDDVGLMFNAGLVWGR